MVLFLVNFLSTIAGFLLMIVVLLAGVAALALALNINLFRALLRWGDQ